MTVRATRYLYLSRHAEASPEGRLTEAGRRQAELLGERLAAAPITRLRHGPLARTAQTAETVAGFLPNAVPEADDAAGDYPPHFPGPTELPAAFAPTAEGFLAGFDAADRERGPDLARSALTRYTGPAESEDDRHELVITHAFLIGHLVGQALDAPPWRWLTLNPANAALTVIRYTPDRPASVLLFNDMRHLPEELRWTGFPPGPRF
ncbi:histidine phosphatase family protein [Allonocardiopsis opalescens]|uniref:Putative phosphoglycerate mutase n=1 Tax=Allonocardiopsis opalescens TaxID=1144618 RepID=A0A2T0Q3T4_9ACTN|nr:histidine phosphatase family protein [Allonocardiopsis opalescens]PRX98465.1 putative phosphoglycerate mutase [Allonocardiopsis opalescens]